MKKIEDCEGYKNLLASVEHDEKEYGNDHNRYRDKLNWVLSRANHYAEKTGLEAADILDKWESGRTYWYMNYYQECEQPEIKDENVRMFDTIQDLRDSIGTSGFRCPCCEGVSKSPYECDSGVIVSKIKDGKDGPCNWKVFGLFKDMGKGVHVFVKSELHGETMFMPISWEKQEVHS